MDQSLPVTRTRHPKDKPADPNKLGFGQIFTDHVFHMDYREGEGWVDPRIEPYGPLVLDPATMAFHYGQTIFEGLKAYRFPDGSIRLFRPRLNFERINRSNDRMVVPPVDPDFLVGALKQLLRLESDWVPSAPGTSLYIRPFIIATDPFLGVRPSRTYRLMIILSPSGAYYPQGLNPVPIHVETKYVRAVRGGTGEAKTGGNYAASLRSQADAHARGFVQVLWLDGVERKYIEEVGSMNVFFVLGGTLVTPSLCGSILPGITRRSVLELADHWGIPTEERRLSMDEILEAGESGSLSEAFGSGTAAVISPIGELEYDGVRIRLHDGAIGPLSQRVYDTLTGIQYGRLPDPLGWMEPI